MWLLLFAAMFVPGLLLSSVLRMRNHLVIVSTPFSLLLVVSVFFTLKLAGATSHSGFSYLILTFILFVLANSNSVSRSCLLEGLREFQLVIPIVAVVAVYHGIAGAFVDFGADIYQHLLFVQTALTHMNENAGALDLKLKPGTVNLVFHNITALFIQGLGISPQDAIRHISTAYSSLWSVSIFYFSRFVLSKAGVPDRQLYLVSGLALFFYWVSFGINNFSFPRYYIGGPAILNYGVFLAVIVLIVDQLDQKIRLKTIVLSGVLTSVAFVLHPQEMFFVASFLCSLAIVIVMFKLVRYDDASDIPLNQRNVRLSVSIVFLKVILITAVIILIPKYQFDPIPLQNLGEFSKSLAEWNILRPTHQFYTVLGWWGVYTLILATFWIKYVRKSVILTAAMLLPFITVFNPFFAEAYMRLAYPQVLWRLLLAIPLPVLASYLCWFAFSSSVQTSRTRIIHFVLIIPIFLLVMPIKIESFTNDMVKVPSLVRTPEENSYKHWADLLEYLQSIEESKFVLTDPATGYMVRALTKHTHSGFKFLKINYIDYNFDHYRDNPLQKYRDWLLIVNRRDGVINSRLQPPHHIYPDVMLTDKHYGETLLNEIKINQNRYKLLWSQNLIDVYRIN